MKKKLIAAMILSLSAMAATTARAATVLNLGVDVDVPFNFDPLGVVPPTLTPVSFFDGDANGSQLNGQVNLVFTTIPGESVTFTIDATSLLNGYIVNSAELFVDAFDITGTDDAEVYVQGSHVGNLANTPAPSEIPLEFGGRTTESGEEDNSFFDMTPFIFNPNGGLIGDSTFTITIANADLTSGFFNLTPGSPFRLDGINLQFNVTAVPEPTTLISGGIAGLMGLGYSLRRRKQATA